MDALMRHYQASAMQYLNSDQRQTRLKMLADIKTGISMSELRQVNNKPVQGVVQSYLNNRQNAEKQSLSPLSKNFSIGKNDVSMQVLNPYKGSQSMRNLDNQILD